MSNVTLDVAPMPAGLLHTLVVNNVRDASSQSNAIASDSFGSFVPSEYTPVAIGTPQPPGEAVTVPGGIRLTAGGRDLGGTADQMQFSYQSRSGDFDVKVRLESLSLADAWSKAGLVAREDLSAGARFAASLATPNIAGCYFAARGTANGATVVAGSAPVSSPNLWLRLRRAGNQFTAFAGYDGQRWLTLGSTNLALPSPVLLGFAASSRNTNQSTVAEFRDFGETGAASLLTQPLAVEPLGQSSRRTSLVISEIMYNPLDRADRRNLEFVELFNAGATAEDLSGWRLDSDADYVFPAGTVLRAGQFLVVATSPADVQAVYGISGVLGPFSSTNSLPNDRGTVQLRNRIGAVFQEAQYDTDSPWPAAADGAGHSLVLARPSYGEGNVRAWAASDSVGGSPGRLDPIPVDPLRGVVINEFLAHTDDPDLDYIELYNHSTSPLDVSGCFLSDARNTNKFTIPPGVIIPPRGFVVFNQNQLGFSLSSGGENIYFRNAANTRVLDAVRFEAQANGVASGRYPDGAPNISLLSARTPGTTNAPLLVHPVVINEIMYNPISRNGDDEYIELYNLSPTSVSLAGWRLQGGASFTFPPNASIPANGYLVIAHRADRLIPRYANLNAANTLGDFNGSLGNGGDRVALAFPDPSFTTNGNVVTTNFNYVVTDEVSYLDAGRWGRWSDGGGSSLELVDPRSDNRLAGNWADSDETTKAGWTTVDVKGVLDNGTSAADQLQVLLLGAGECLIDDVQVVTASGSNVVANSTFESGATGWTAEGTLEASGLESAEGFNSTRSYRVRASDRGDNQVNRIRTPLTAAQPNGATDSIRARVRWLRGHPEILFRLRGNWLEAAVTMDLPTNLGTPGAPNSRAVSNAGPAISDVTHFPPVPAANEGVTVTARVHDPDGLASVQVRYRIDPSATLLSATMTDNGTGVDAVAGDGLFSALIPGQGTGVLVAFRVEATDAVTPAANSLFPKEAPTKECLVRFGESVPPGNFPSYRFWMTQASFNAWDVRNNLNNTLNDVTFVLGNHRVIYNGGAVYAGSPYIGPSFTTPTGNRCGYSVEFPGDDPFLGDAALVLDWPGGHGNENTAIQEQMAYYIADQMNLPFSHRYFIRLTVNGVTDMARNGVFEAVFQPGGDFTEQWVPENSEGDFFKIDRAFEFSDAGGLVADPEPQLRIFTTPDLVNGGTKKKIEKYRWYWLKRSFDQAHDYTNLVVLADALNATGPEPYTSQTEALVDVEQWMGIFAFEHIINNFDSWGHDIGKNMYMFKPAGGRWQLYAFDLDWLMLVSPSGPGNYTASTGPLFACDDPTVTRMYLHPPFRRAYFRAVQNAVNRAFVSAKYEVLMDAKYDALVANGITLCDGQALASPTAVKTWFAQRRTYLAGQLSAVNATFSITNNAGADFTSDTNFITLAGSAPIDVHHIQINGVDYPVTWTSVTTWSIRVPVEFGVNPLALRAVDATGQVLSNVTDQITITSTATPPSPAGRVVINEVHYHAPLAGAEFVEIFNTSSNAAFDLGGWQLNGIDHTFAKGTILDPRSFLVLTENRDAFGAAYGGALRVDQFSGRLDQGGETLTLLRPGPAGQFTPINTVTYDDDPPWPVSADGMGPSLQLIDPTKDTRRVANWSDGAGWRFFSLTGVPGNNATNLLLFLASAGAIYLDDFILVESTPGSPGTNYIVNGDFETGSLAPWRGQNLYSNTVVSADFSHSGSFSLHLIGEGQGSSLSFANQLLPLLTATNTYTLSFWFLPSRNGAGLTARVTLGFRTITPIDYRPQLTSPGAPNGMAATS
ncbi:MAG TPA: lamin tail domain-containing protein, partial [Verrucomicrobiae bacterium]|nr:lamin tail domain-containing protein [Verrucomicrobiae bacterium]